MIYLPLAAGVPFIMKLVGTIWVLSALCLIFIILIQKGRGGGLTGAFGGLGGAGGLLGTKTGDFLTWVTIGLVVAFLGLGVIMVKYYKPTGVAVAPTALTNETSTGTTSGSQTPPPPTESGAAQTTPPGAADSSKTPTPAPAGTDTAPSADSTPDGSTN